MGKEDRSWNALWMGAGAAAAMLGFALHRRNEEQARQAWHRAQAQHGRGAALVTGASSGIGAEFARQLAARGYDLVLVARREERLQQLAEQLNVEHGVAVEALPADLTQAEDVDRVCRRLLALSNLQLLVNNAGFGIEGPFAESDITRQVDMIELHVLANVRLMRAGLAGLIARHHGGIINVSSLASFMALPSNANYSATKSYLTMFTQALHAELRDTGVRALALCPGFTYSEMHGPDDSSRREDMPEFLWYRASLVVREALNCLERDKVLCVPGAVYKLGALFVRIGALSDLATRFAPR